MKKSQLSYLRRIIGSVIANRNREMLTEKVFTIKAPSTPIYSLMRDIVCDSRFYSVIDDDSFWKNYGAYKIGSFINQIEFPQGEEGEKVTLRKEEFLNEWMTAHMIPLEPERRKEIDAEIRLIMLTEEGTAIPDPDDHDGTSLGIIYLGDGIKDTTNSIGEPGEGLPPRLQDYMNDSDGDNSQGLHNNGHKADASFLASIDPSIRKLAEKIGRRGGFSVATRGKFRPAPKSDINGISTGNDLNSLLPSELALLADKSSEKIFLDRYVRRRLQTFSSVSESKNKRIEKGAIFICIDTSGSMVDEPEVMAKTVALAISIAAQKEKRPVCILNYSDSVSFFILKDLERQRKKLLRFLSVSYGGGNDENKLFRFLFSRMPDMPAYRKIANDFKGADLLIISDFRWGRIEPNTFGLIEDAMKGGMRIFTIATEDGGHIPIKSDNQYKYEEGGIKESRM